ncbi:MAG: hypothetical protein Q7S87_08580 [Agitococcus sp.]|nr:hypothetical protein [Agitococcus sp.]MDO9177625.1 hypothetical protein [Agitococcus sp.]
MSFSSFTLIRHAILSFLLGCAALSSFAATVTAEFQEECRQQLGPTKIDAIVLPSQVLYDFTYSSDVLSQKGVRQRELHQSVVGLTTATLRHTITWGGDVLAYPEGPACTRPAIQLTLEVGPQHVDIGREFPRGSCAFNKIAAHELRHVYANQETLVDAARYLEYAMREHYGTQILYGDKATLKANLSSDVQRVWIPLLKQKIAEVDLRHNAIDSPEEYASNQVECDGEIPRALAKAGKQKYLLITPRRS